jgi:hypothetical protein
MSIQITPRKKMVYSDLTLPWEQRNSNAKIRYYWILELRIGKNIFSQKTRYKSKEAALRKADLVIKELTDYLNTKQG